MKMFTPVNFKEKMERSIFFVQQSLKSINFLFKVCKTKTYKHLNSANNLPIINERLNAAFLTMFVWRKITDFLSISLMKKAIAAAILILYCFLNYNFLKSFFGFADHKIFL